ncbi:probable serine/threonine-protein kinase PIX13 isoform X2 [Olea europaea var. sylvestris]|uniref:non-specific serine/threonine protein kinase n=1 Tax=Olea europaea subsp. europaea TaxID=158383 RepID=A0A8S0UK42_OLEEU|nr:probable serine/threonine-protein kinase PIX13 isoform X2 [Olea europaea var. sylvestris]CAA3017982.1 Probable serine/threonine-protein kinase Cx32, chloroplastic [Olea europaea subsp. europaea]
MGNCWPKPVDDLPSTNNIKPTTIGTDNAQSTKNKIINTRKSSSSPSPADLGGEGGGGDDDGQTVPPSGQIIGPNLKLYTFAELKRATRNFRPDTLLGEGGFGRVFKGWVDNNTYSPSRVGVGIPVAVKKSNPDSAQGLKEWQAEVKFLGKFSHPNLVKLLGYCWEERQFLLVYEYVQKGSLESHLFRRGIGEPIPWDTRIKIAIGAARGLAFLHTKEKSVIYRDFKASNILLDGEFNAKLSDFGLAKLGPIDGNSHVTTKVVGTYGYAAPEYMATGHLYVKSDVYGFGVVLLEIITGLRILDPNRPNGQTNLVDWARPLLPNKKKLRRLMDPRLENQYPSKGAFRTAKLIIKCLEPHLKLRPDMEQVLETLEQISTIQMTPKDLKAQTSQEQRHGDGRSLHHH